jgi:hypothetical protein
MIFSSGLRVLKAFSSSSILFYHYYLYCLRSTTFNGYSYLCCLYFLNFSQRKITIVYCCWTWLTFTAVTYDAARLRLDYLLGKELPGKDYWCGWWLCQYKKNSLRRLLRSNEVRARLALRVVWGKVLLPLLAIIEISWRRYHYNNKII